MKYVIILLAGILLSITTFAQKEILRTRYNSDGTIGFQSYDVTINPKAVGDAGEFLRNALSFDPNDSMHLVNIIRKNGNTYLSYQQYYKGYKVLYATYAIQAKNDKIESIHGYYKKIGTPSTSISINETSALETVLKYVPAIKYGWQDSFSQNRYKEVTKDSNATLYPKGTLVIVRDDSVTHTYRLSYQFHIYAVQPLRDCNVYVDAITGNIISKENLILDNNTTGTASTLYSGTRAITMDSYSTPIQYRLQEGRPEINGATIQIRTYNMNNTGVRTNTPFTNTSTTWATPDASLDVHWGTEKVCDYWSQVRQWNSYDGQAGDLIGYVHANLPALDPADFSNNDNAFWIPV